MDLSNIENSDIVLNSVYLGIVDSGKVPEVPFITLLFRYDSDRLLWKIFLNYGSILSSVRSLLGRMLAGIDYSVLFRVGQIALEGCLAGVGMYGAVMEQQSEACTLCLEERLPTYEQMLFP